MRSNFHMKREKRKQPAVSSGIHFSEKKDWFSVSDFSAPLIPQERRKRVRSKRRNRPII
jgi:hypothetical protein